MLAPNIALVFVSNSTPSASVVDLIFMQVAFLFHPNYPQVKVAVWG